MKIIINKQSVNYKVSGSGRDVIILHGWGGKIGSVAPIHSFLERNFRTYSIDLPGFGESYPPPKPWSSNNYADLVKEFIELQKINNPIVLGHSFGGKIALQLALKTKLHKLILVDSAGIPSKKGLNYFVKVYFVKIVKLLQKQPFFRRRLSEFSDDLKSKFGSADYKNSSGVMRQTLVKVVNEDLRDIMRKVIIPTLLIWGEKDTATPLSNGKMMEKLIPKSGLVIFKNAGHFSYLDNLFEFLTVVNHFLKSDIAKYLGGDKNCVEKLRKNIYIAVH